MTELFNQKYQTRIRKELRNNRPRAERVLWRYLHKKKLGCRFRRQFGIGPYIVDFYCPKKRIVIELDGDSHFSSEAQKYDRARDEYLDSLDIQVVRFTNIEVYQDPDSVIRTIKALLNGILCFLPLRRGG